MWRCQDQRAGEPLRQHFDLIAIAINKEVRTVRAVSLAQKTDIDASRLGLPIMLQHIAVGQYSMIDSVMNRNNSILSQSRRCCSVLIRDLAGPLESVHGDYKGMSDRKIQENKAELVRNVVFFDAYNRNDAGVLPEEVDS